MQHPSAIFVLEQRYVKDSREEIETRCITMSYGIDLVNVQYMYIVAQNDVDAQVIMKSL